ncbi:MULTISPECIES: GDSL-type esterase/lipase family protein [Nocardiopsis]|uniref:GDSL-type esterase/lipase family protein n=2 Tax=Nocardiopsis alba TaxID=53437 RepID=A0ABV5DXC0_9ACTN|nr:MULTISPECIES: GDSL-type esterase/lipase family protein [Nocardiopsis]AFR07745.1 GDSL-like Lipase/Acylhydrolase family protein [Nocardiopsis alba ATCC BAA-2165]MEC3895105.1 GDSL-type esterase/lipase family protein [Nocardiopsis sp. LDBS1602]
MATGRRRIRPLVLTGALTLVLAVVGAGLWLINRPSSLSEEDTEAAPWEGRGQVRLMLAGDSMTHGADGDRTWRYHLWNHLEPHVEGLDFVGPFSAPATPEQIVPPELFGNEPTPGAPEGDPEGVEYLDPDFDQDHNARWGRTLADASTTITRDVAVYRPDVLCVMIGINDLLHPITAEEMEGRLRAYVAGARSASPKIRILFAEAPPTVIADQDQGFALRLYVYNELVRELSAELSTPESPVVSFDLAGAEKWDVETDTYDGTHPDDSGEIKIAAGFADALSREFGLGPGYPRPLPIAPAEAGGEGTAAP